MAKDDLADPAGDPVLAGAWRLIEDYLAANDDPETPVIEYLEASDLAGRIDFALGPEGLPAADLLPLLESYLRYSLRSGHRQFHNQLWGGFNQAAFLGDVTASLANTSMYTYEVAPVATLIEAELIAKMCSILGFADGEGIFTSGGSNANLIAMLCARHQAFPEVKDRGFTGGERPAVLVSDQSHYSFRSAAGLLGVGLGRVVKVKSDGCGRMIPGELEREISECRERGETPFMVGATAGTTVLGAFDPLPEIAEVCRRHGRDHSLWLHVDGAWGGPAILSPKHRHLLAGVENADSFAWDSHKLMGAPLICSTFLTRRRGLLYQVCSTSAGDPEYLFHDDDGGACDLGKLSLQCGRRVDAVKLWLMWKHYGDRGFARRVERLFELATLAAAEVERRDRLELVAPTRSLNVCFRYLPAAGVGMDPVAIDRLNVEARELLRKSGRAMVNYATVEGKVAMRLVFANPEVGEADVVRFFDLFVDAAEELLAARKPAAV